MGRITTGLAFVALLAVGVIGFLGYYAYSVFFSPCPQPIVPEPSVNYVPPGWFVDDSALPCALVMDDGTTCGRIGYLEDSGLGYVYIWYGEIPESLQGRENDLDTLIAKAIERSDFDPQVTGALTVSGQPAGYVRGLDHARGSTNMTIVFVGDSTCIDISTGCDVTSENGAQVRAIIDSISFQSR